MMNEKVFIEVNGVSQGMFIVSEDTRNPVLLFLHGGPGSPEICFTQDFPTGLEKQFTVCWWEQRGSGISYSKEISAETMTIEQMIDDTLVVIDFLRTAFEQDKVYIMGHSWGSLLGVLVAQRAPGLLHAYIGVGQVVRQTESEQLAYAYMLEKFQEAGNKKMIRKLEKHPINQGAPIDVPYLSVRSQGMNRLGIGMTRQWKSMIKPALTVLRYKGYSVKDKIGYIRGGAFSLNNLWDSVLGMDLFEQVPRLRVPVYIFHGKYDYQVSYVLSKKYLQALEAPIKGFYTFGDSAHSPCFEEPEKTGRFLRENVLCGKTDLAD